MRTVLWLAMFMFVAMGAGAASVDQGSAALLCMGLALVCGLLIRTLW